MADPAAGFPSWSAPARPTRYNVLRGLEAGADGFITKRREPDEIVGCVRRVLSRPAGEPDPGQRTRVSFLGQEFELAAGREQLLDVLVSAFEDVLHLNTLAQASALAQGELNRQLEERNLQLQRLADSERQAHEDRKKAESQLVQAEKLSALGLMVAGVAHEVNNPLAFVINNLAVLKREVGLLREMIGHYQEIEKPLAEDRPDLADRLHAYAEDMELAFTLESLDRLFERTGEGLRRIQQIVRNLRDFARLDESDLKEVDLNVGIVSTLNVVRNHAREHQVALVTDLAPLPGVTCYPAKINQVVLNLVANAIDASAPGIPSWFARAPPARGSRSRSSMKAAASTRRSATRSSTPFLPPSPKGWGRAWASRSATASSARTAVGSPSSRTPPGARGSSSVSLWSPRRWRPYLSEMKIPMARDGFQGGGSTILP